MQKALLGLVLVLALCAVGCRPLEVQAEPGGSQKLPLPGEQHVTGVVSRTLSYQGRVVPKGTLVRIEETWLLRHDKSAKPPGYRVAGLYDTTTQTDGLMLPKHSIDTFYLGAILPGDKDRVAIPAAHFERR